MERISNKSRGTTILLAFFFGGLGIHKFYLDKPGLGILYAIFVWTFIPAFLAIIDVIVLLCMNNKSFDDKYNFR